MKDIGPQPATSALVDGDSQVDIEVIIEQIWSDLGRTTSRSEIRKALMEVIPAYKGARIKTYVPIFLRRDVVRQLQVGFTRHQREGVSKVENASLSKAADSASKHAV